MKPLYRVLLAIAVSALLAGLALKSLAGIASNEAPTVYMILLADNSVEKGKEWPKSLEECVARAKAIIPQGSCSIRRTFTNVGDCTDVAKPAWPRELDADGFVIKPGIRGKLQAGSDSDYDFEVEDFVAAPFPECWVKGWRVAVLEDFVDDTEELLANDETPGNAWPAEMVAERASPESCTARHEMCVIYPEGSGDENCGAPPPKCVNAENFYTASN